MIFPSLYNRAPDPSSFGQVLGFGENSNLNRPPFEQDHSNYPPSIQLCHFPLIALGCRKRCDTRICTWVQNGLFAKATHVGSRNSFL